MRSSLFTGLAAAILASNVLAISPFIKNNGLKKIHHENEHVATLSRRAIKAGKNGWGTFDQLIDHANPKLGTFEQRYWYGTEFWKGPGSPIILVNIGEQDAEGFNISYTTNETLTGRYAQENGGAVVILEHRYWGESSPYDLLTVKNLSHLTLDNSLEDMVNFAKNFVPPFDKSGKSAHENVPWVNVGCSYPGALVGWLSTLHPGVFHAGHASSAVVEAVGDFYDYYDPVQEYMPKNCSRDVTAVIDYVDKILLNGTKSQKKTLKKKFGLQTLGDADFANVLASGPASLQDNSFSTFENLGYNTLNSFCDVIEGVYETNKTNPGAKGVGLKEALKGYARYIKLALPGTCDEAELETSQWNGTVQVDCLSTQNASAPVFTDLSVEGGNRQWMWFLCNEAFEWWQTGASPRKKGDPSVVSRLVTAKYNKDQCAKYFPNEKGPDGTVGVSRGKSAKTVNKMTGGWENTNSTRLIYVNGALDPWRDATMASHSRPGGPLKSTKALPHFVVKGGTHCSDFYGDDWAANEGLAEIVDSASAQMKEWIDEFYTAKNKTRNGEGGKYFVY